jgi:hypothetical protein
MNLIKFIAADRLFLVIANSNPVTNALGMSPIGGMVRIGPPIRSITSTITDIPSAESARDRKNFFLKSNLCIINL